VLKPIPDFLCWRIQSESAKLPSVDEGRKRVLLIAASILAARKLAQHGSEAQVPATISAIADAIRGRADYAGD